MEHAGTEFSLLVPRQWKPAHHRAKHLLAYGLGFALVAIALAVMPGAYGDPEVKNLLQSSGACDNWQTHAHAHAHAHARDDPRDRPKNSPLVQEAERFALLLNPPQVTPARPTDRAASPMAMAMAATTTAAAAVKALGPGLRPRQATAKFTLHATSYYPSSPDESLALINEPGKGHHWVRQGRQVGYIVIQEIRTGMIVWRDGDRVREMLVESPKTPGAAPLPKPPSAGQYAKHTSGVAPPPVNGTGSSTRGTGIARRDMVPLRTRPQRPAQRR